MDSLTAYPRTILDALAWEKHVALVELKKKQEMRRLAQAPLQAPPPPPAHVVVNVRPLPAHRKGAQCPTCTIA
jgi:hypothetical protein